MSTVGYGDITPESSIEILWGLFAVLCSSCMFAYCINTIGQILYEFSKKDSEIQNKIFMINKYMVRKGISKILQLQIREYLEYYWQENDIDETQYEESIINQQLSIALREQLLMDSNRIILKDSPIFKNNFSSDVITKTLNLIQQSRCTPEEQIVRKGDISEQIFFIEKGIFLNANLNLREVEIILEGEDEDKQIGKLKCKSLKTLGKGECFGIQGFFTGQTSSFSIRSKDFCKLLYIKREDFLLILKEYPEDYERFCYIKDNIILYDNSDLLKKECMSCLKTNHSTQYCPQLHFMPRKDKIIQSYIYQTTKIRQFFSRKGLIKTTKGIKIDKDQILLFQRQNKVNFSSILDKQKKQYYYDKQELIDQYIAIFEIQSLDESQSVLQYQQTNPDELYKQKTQEYQGIASPSVKSNKNKLKIESDFSHELNYQLKSIEQKFFEETKFQKEISSSDFTKNSNNDSPSIENKQINGNANNKQQQQQQPRTIFQRNQSIRQSSIIPKESSQVPNNSQEQFEMILSMQSKNQIQQQAEVQQILGSQKKILEPYSKYQKKQHENKVQYKHDFTKAFSSLFQNSPSKLNNYNNNNMQDLRDQILQVKEALLNQRKDVQANLEDEFDQMKNFEFYFPLNNLNFILTTLNLEKGERKWFTFKYYKIYNDIYSKQSNLEQSFNRLRKRTAPNLILPHTFTPSIVNAPVLLQNIISESSQESNKLQKSYHQKFSRDISSVFRQRTKQMKSSGTNKDYENDQIVSHNNSILDYSNSILSVNSHLNAKKSTKPQLQDHKSQNQINQSQFRKSLNGSRNFNNQSQQVQLDSSEQFNGIQFKSSEFDEDDIQVEFEQNITKAQQLNVICPNIKRAISLEYQY